MMLRRISVEIFEIVAYIAEIGGSELLDPLVDDTLVQYHDESQCDAFVLRFKRERSTPLGFDISMHIKQI